VVERDLKSMFELDKPSEASVRMMVLLAIFFFAEVIYLWNNQRVTARLMNGVNKWARISFDHTCSQSYVFDFLHSFLLRIQTIYIRRHSHHHMLVEGFQAFCDRN